MKTQKKVDNLGNYKVAIKKILARIVSVWDTFFSAFFDAVYSGLATALIDFSRTKTHMESFSFHCNVVYDKP